MTHSSPILESDSFDYKTFKVTLTVEYLVVSISLFRLSCQYLCPHTKAIIELRHLHPFFFFLNALRSLNMVQSYSYFPVRQM